MGHPYREEPYVEPQRVSWFGRWLCRCNLHRDVHMTDVEGAPRDSFISVDLRFGDGGAVLVVWIPTIDECVRCHRQRPSKRTEYKRPERTVSFVEGADFDMNIFGKTAL